MGNRRGRGEGGIYKTKEGTWRAQIQVDGERLGNTLRTRKQAVEWIRNIKNEFERGLSADGISLFYGKFLDEWLIVKKQSVAEQTWSYYSQIIRDYIKPNLGYLKIREITSRKIQKFYNDMVENGVGLRTIEKTHTIIHASLNAAIKYGMIPSNPEKGTEYPKPKKKEMKFMNKDEVLRFLRISRENRDRNYALFYLAIVTGMRQGELLGLMWKDIDLENGIISVKQNLKRMIGGGLVLSKPKTESSLRSIRIGSDSIEVLREQKNRIENEEQEIKGLWIDDGFVFPTKIGTAMDPSALVKKFKLSLKRAGLSEIRFHDLRHTSASLMLNNGVDIFVASKRLGHAKPSITLDVYGHLLSSAQNEVADKMESLLSI